MKVMECKACGGRLELVNGRYICQFCGNIWRDENQFDASAIKLASAYEKLRGSDFGDAELQFTEVINEQKDNYEAYWGRALARNGIIFVTDLVENKKVPTCNNISESSFPEHPDVKKAIALAPAETAATYRNFAVRIENIRREWLEKARKEPPYDIFICFKDSDREKGIARTQDSYDAQELYTALVEKGYKVFFSRVSLRDKVSEQYEPYIYNALKTAKVMIVFGEKPEYFTSTWLKNEWSRYIARMTAGEKHKNSLVVVYKNMSPADLPVALKSRQCMNAAEMTFFSDLATHVEKVIALSNQDTRLERVSIQGGQIGKKATQLNQKTISTRDVGGSAMVEISLDEQQRMSLVRTYLRSGEWKEAEKLIEEVLFDNPSSGEAVLCKILVSLRCRNEAELKICPNLSGLNYGLISKVLDCSSKEKAGQLLDMFYSMSAGGDTSYKKLLEVILPFDYVRREQRLNEAFGECIKKGYSESLDVLLTTLKPEEVDRYVQLVLNMAATFEIAKDYAKAETYVKRALDVDEGSERARIMLFRVNICKGESEKKIVADVEALLRYSQTEGNELLNKLFEKVIDEYKAGRDVQKYAKILLKYYSGNLKVAVPKIMELAKLMVAAKQFGEAKYYLDIVCQSDSMNAEAYLYLCLAKIEAINLESISSAKTSIKTCPEFNKYLALINENQREKCIQLAQQQERMMEHRKEVEKQQKKYRWFISPIIPLALLILCFAPVYCAANSLFVFDDINDINTYYLVLASLNVFVLAIYQARKAKRNSKKNGGLISTLKIVAGIYISTKILIMMFGNAVGLGKSDRTGFQMILISIIFSLWMFVGTFKNAIIRRK